MISSISNEAAVLPRRLRVLHVVSHLALGGAERVALTIIDALRSECEFGVYGVRGLGDGEVGVLLHERLQRSGVPFFSGLRVPMRYGGMFTGAIGLSRAIRNFRPELIHLHTEIPEASYALLVAVRPRTGQIPLVRTIHNTVFWHAWRPLGRWCDRQMARSFCAGVSMGAVDAVMELRSESGAGALPLAPALIYNALPGNSVAEPRPAPTAGPITIVFGGRLELQKGADLLARITAQTQLPPGRTVRLRIFGSGRFAASLAKFSAHPPAGWTVEVHPPFADFSAQLARADLVVMPSRFEGLPLVAIESTLAGVPVVVTDAPGLREAVPPEHPWRATPGDARSFAAVLSDALAHSERWPGAVRAAQRFAAERFSVEAMREGYRALYRQALAQPRG